MTSRPFHRSRLFWLGALGLIFLAWVWWDSSATGTLVTWGSGRPEGREVWLGSGEVGWQATTHLDGYTSGNHIEGHRYRILKPENEGKRGFDFPPAFTSEAETMETIATEEVCVALWVIIAGYMLLWLGVVLWWQRRKARLIARMLTATGGAA